MRRAAIALLLLAAVATIVGNPIALPSIVISELRFAEDDSWELELEFRDLNPTLPIDSISLVSGSWRAALPTPTMPAGSGFIATLAQKDLPGSPAMSPAGDSLLVEYRTKDHMMTDALVFGARCTATVPAPRVGQSIVRVKDRVFALTRTPSIGSANDSSGACGTLRGRVLDGGGNPVADIRFSIDYPFTFTTASDGAFSARVFARITATTVLLYRHGSGSSSCAIQPLQYAMEPDSTIGRDIVVTSPLLSADDVPLAGAGLFRLHPNPVRPGGTLLFSSDLPVAAMEMTLTLTDLRGGIVLETDVRETPISLSLPRVLPAGLYMAAVRSRGRLYDALKLAVVK
jgi:hypothetical protein